MADGPVDDDTQECLTNRDEGASERNGWTAVGAAAAKNVPPAQKAQVEDYANRQGANRIDALRSIPRNPQKALEQQARSKAQKAELINHAKEIEKATTGQTSVPDAVIKRTQSYPARGANGPPASAASRGTTAYRYVGEKEAMFADDEGYIPNTTQKGDPKNVFISPNRYTVVAEAESALQIGAQNPNGTTASPAFRVTVDTSGVHFLYAGNVEGGTGIELVTRQTLPVIRVEPLE